MKTNNSSTAIINMNKYQKVNSARPKSKRKNIYPLMVATTSAMLLDMVLNASLINVATSVIWTLGLSALAWRSELEVVFKLLSKLNRKYNLATVVFTLVGSFFLLDALSQPASAFFFQNVETWMIRVFTQTSSQNPINGLNTVISLVFNVLRGLFLLYLGIGLVKVIQAAREDEDWQMLARTPMVILMAVTVGNTLANLIIPGE
ncbi:MAG: hypothetical protein AAF378_05545 [Cyanobacteria bacterium P01_A01_bin.84]